MRVEEGLATGELQQFGDVASSLEEAHKRIAVAYARLENRVEEWVTPLHAMPAANGGWAWFGIAKVRP